MVLVNSAGVPINVSSEEEKKTTYKCHVNDFEPNLILDNNNNNAPKLEGCGIRELFIDSICVYSDRALMKRRVRAKVEAGFVDLVVGGLSPFMQGETLTASGKGEASILEVSYKNARDVKNVDSNQMECDKLRKKITQVELAIERNKKVQTFLENYRARVLNLQCHNQKALNTMLNTQTMTHFSQYSKFHSEQCAKLQEEKVNLEYQLKDIKKELDKKLEASKKVNNNGSPQKEVTIALYARKACDVDVVFSYIVTGATWKPSYDVRAVSSDDSHIEVTYFGVISQSTQENWDKVPVSLATALPSVGGSIPKLAPVYINTTTISTSAPSVSASSSSSSSFPGGSGGGGSSLARRTSSTSSTSSSTTPAAPPTTGANEYVSRSGHETAVAQKGLSGSTYHITRPANIPSDNIPHKVTIASITLPCNFTIYAVPYFSSYCFLRANCVNDSNYTFMGGDASVFLDNTYVTKTYLKNTSVNETFELFLGVDARVKIDVKPTKQIRESKTVMMIRSANVLKIEKRYVIKNTAQTKLHFIAVDQYPTVSDSKITVAINEPPIGTNEKVANVPLDSSRHNGKRADTIMINSGRNLEWRFYLEPGEQVEVPYLFNVEWPSNMHLGDFQLASGDLFN